MLQWLLICSSNMIINNPLIRCSFQSLKQKTLLFQEPMIKLCKSTGPHYLVHSQHLIKIFMMKNYILSHNQSINDRAVINHSCLNIGTLCSICKETQLWLQQKSSKRNPETFQQFDRFCIRGERNNSPKCPRLDRRCLSAVRLQRGDVFWPSLGKSIIISNAHR